MLVAVSWNASRVSTVAPMVVHAASGGRAATPTEPTSASVVSLSSEGKALAATDAQEPERAKAAKLREAIGKIDFHNTSGSELSKLGVLLAQNDEISDDIGPIMSAATDVEPPRSADQKFDLTKQFADVETITANAARTDPSMRWAAQYATHMSSILDRLQSFVTSDRLHV